MSVIAKAAGINSRIGFNLSMFIIYLPQFRYPMNPFFTTSYKITPSFPFSNRVFPCFHKQSLIPQIYAHSRYQSFKSGGCKKHTGLPITFRSANKFARRHRPSAKSGNSPLVFNCIFINFILRKRFTVIGALVYADRGS